MASSPVLSVVIPTYQRPDLLAQCLDGLRAQDAPPTDYEICVVDDASGPATPEVLRRAEDDLPNLRWASQPTNLGPAAARNRAVAMSTAPLLLFLDDDIVASPSLVRTHIALHDGRPDTYGVVGLVEWLPTLKVSQFMRWLDTIPYQFAFPQMDEGLQGDPTRAFYTCNLSVSRALFERAGGFDERFPFPAYEDTELAIRLVERGFELDFRRAALAWNSRPITLDQFCARMTMVARSAHVLADVMPGLDPVVADLATPQFSDAHLLMLRLLDAITPARVDSVRRSAYYWERVRRSYARGLAEGLQRAT